MDQTARRTAEMIDAGSTAELDRIIRVLQTTTGDVVVVATVETFAPYATIEEYALKLFERAGIGTRKADSGALVLLAVKDRRANIVTFTRSETTKIEGTGSWDEIGVGDRVLVRWKLGDGTASRVIVLESAPAR